MDEIEFKAAITAHATRLEYGHPAVKFETLSWIDEAGVVRVSTEEIWIYEPKSGPPIRIQGSPGSYYSPKNLLTSIKGRLTAGQKVTSGPMRKGLQSYPSKCRERWLWAFAPGQPDSLPHEHAGKWMMFVAEKYIDDTWKSVKAAVESGLAPQAKTSTKASNGGGPYVICVYALDSRDITEVMAIREKLRNLGFTRKIPFKLDETTLRGEKGSVLSA